MSHTRGIVTASTLAAAEAGAEVLRMGGNAVDAAVATALASCVADPCNTGLGGYGGHLVVAEPQGEPVCVDFDTWVEPGAAPPPPEAEFGPDVVAMPSVVAGLAAALRRFGTKSWREVCAPAHRLATEGVESNGTTANAFREVEGDPFVAECFSFDPGPAPEDGRSFRFRQPLLAGTLEQLGLHGPEWFYEGPVGDAACRMLQEGGRAVARADWSRIPEGVTIAPAARYDIDGFRLYSAPLGTSGSASLFGTIAAGRAALRRHAPGSDAAMLDWAQALASIWSYRLGSPHGNDFADGDIAGWVERALAFAGAANVPDGVGHTCHLNVAAPDGSMVAVTLTHGPTWFGARRAVPGTGIILNAGRRLFSFAAPVVRSGRAYAVTNMAPTVVRAPDAEIAIGCPGARRIPTNIGLVLARHLFEGLSLQDAVAAGRFHAESKAKATFERERWPDGTGTQLASVFGEVGPEDWRLYYGPLTAIRRSADGVIETGLDDRITRGFAAPM